jgi:hypothetical protein
VNIVRIGYALFILLEVHLHSITDHMHMVVNRGRHFARLIDLSFQAQREDGMKGLIIWLLLKVKGTDMGDEVTEGGR